MMQQTSLRRTAILCLLISSMFLGQVVSIAVVCVIFSGNSVTGRFMLAAGLGRANN